ncbi:MAG: hypothetical protein GY861_09300 [bacterium]|nr:hypothetical protein [bacterium]
MSRTFVLIATIIYALLGLTTVVSINITADSLFTVILFGLLFIMHIVLFFAVYGDAGDRGLNKNWFLVPFIFGWIGGLIYYIVSMNKGQQS